MITLTIAYILYRFGIWIVLGLGVLFGIREALR